MQTKMFPIQPASWHDDNKRLVRVACVDIPWVVIAKHERQAITNYGLPLADLAVRGGLSAAEALAVLADRPYREMDPALALSTLAIVVQRDILACCGSLDDTPTAAPPPIVQPPVGAEHMFPIRKLTWIDCRGDIYAFQPPPIPWALLAPHEDYAKRNWGIASLETQAAKGGLTALEALDILERRRQDDLSITKETNLTGYLNLMVHVQNYLLERLAAATAAPVATVPLAGKPRELTLLERIESYLGNGGLFNPEMMEHMKVRDLIMDCREQLREQEAAGAYYVKQIELLKQTLAQYRKDRLSALHDIMALSVKLNTLTQQEVTRNE